MSDLEEFYFFQSITEYFEALDYPEERIEEYIGFLKLYECHNVYPGLSLYNKHYEVYFEMACALIQMNFNKEYRDFMKKRKRYLKKDRKETKEIFRSGFKTLSKTFTENGENIKAHIIKIIVEPTLRENLKKPRKSFTISKSNNSSPTSSQFP